MSGTRVSTHPATDGAPVGAIDIVAAREDLVSRGVDVNPVFRIDGGRVPAPDPGRAA